MFQVKEYSLKSLLTAQFHYITFWEWQKQMNRKHSRGCQSEQWKSLNTKGKHMEFYVVTEQILFVVMIIGINVSV
jgi:hypothetical protein